MKITINIEPTSSKDPDSVTFIFEPPPVGRDGTPQPYHPTAEDHALENPEHLIQTCLYPITKTMQHLCASCGWTSNYSVR